MASANEKDDIPMLPISDSSSRTRARSVSISTPTSSFDNSTVVLGYTGPLRTHQRHLPLVQVERYPSDVLEHKNSSDNEKVLKHAKLGMCNDPYCTICPYNYNHKAAQVPHARVSPDVDSTLCDGAKAWARRFASSVNVIVNPHNKHVKRWSKFFAVSCLLAIFIDPLFFFLVKVHEKHKCIMIDWPMTDVFVVVRSLTDFVFFINILLQFRMAYVAPESRVVGFGKLVSDPLKIALHYVRGKFFLDLFILMPVPQIMILCIIPKYLVSSINNNHVKFLLRAAALFQYIPKLCRLLPFLAGQSPTGFIFESTWATFFINLLTFMLAGHFVGSCWYLLGLQSVKRCMHGQIRNLRWVDEPKIFIDCAHRSNASRLQLALWKESPGFDACFQEDGFPYGIYLKVANLTYHSSIFTRYTYSLFWGFQQISTLAGNQVPTYYLPEVLFTMGIIGLGLLLFALLIGNIQNFLQALGKRNLEMTLRQRDVEQWMSHRRLPDGIRKRVREAEQFNWAATRGVNEELLFENMPDDLQTDIRRHLFQFLEKVKIFSSLDESIIDAIHERLKLRTYIKDSKVLRKKGPVKKMVFIVRGEMQSINEEDRSVLTLSEGDVCGEELLTLCTKRSGGTTIKMPPKGLVISNRDVTCITNVEAFWLSVADIEDLASLFSRFPRSHRVQRATRNDSPYWRLRQIQVARRNRRKQLQRGYTA
ncbi:PREDICTED: probable cyclic nucleotide-gated ion channel 20, chloroplastic isoform X2 [Camelina sativa]|uniref:Probable cyclic nucleotide-gated ion channel 20, chloroplastic isoform X2 n=1 Tax=Camelina sativa TaxID=90675 RepID=A0ABM0U3W5_CAMSA|nr:PREDICTED: probable cyclic nucleotide-gated ion channel 20, chloroplastic isoform X2 [Camelina sativa]